MFNKIISFLKISISSVIGILQKPYFGFIEGHSYISIEQLVAIKSLIGSENDNVVKEFETGFAKIIGDGECVSYAAARMGFYDLLKLKGIGVNDEVVLTGYTCVVMVDAVVRTGATPIYSDIDIETFGSSIKSISSCITRSTKMIVAQHSFGIPCDIRKIQLLARSKNIFLLEDCALTLGSSVDGVVVGNFGDAALFSTDHSKPINTMTGGMIYTKNISLANMLRSSRDSYDILSVKKQNALWKRFLIERKYCNPEHFSKIKLIDLMYIFAIKIFNAIDPFLSNDFKVTKDFYNNPYPAKIPPFLAKIGVYEIQRWKVKSNDRKKMLSLILNSAFGNGKKLHIPVIYFKSSIDIIPLRFVWSERNGTSIRKLFSHFVDVDNTWFMKPIVGTNEPLESLGYLEGSCPVSEVTGKNIINIPCCMKLDEQQRLIEELELVFFSMEGK
jgi:perosamine synthetase